MNGREMPRLSLGQVEAHRPIVQGGMGVGISLSGLATAVAQAGAVGVISAAGIGMLDPDYRKDFHAANCRALRQEIRRVRQATSGVLGVNIMMALTDSDALIATAVEEGVDVIFLGAGLPLRPPATVPLEIPQASSTAFVPIVSSGRAARLILKHWDRHFARTPDGFVVEGPLAGGHLGFRREHLASPDSSLEHLLQDTLHVVAEYEIRYSKRIPVLAAGGIYDGQDIRTMIELGASGVQMATRFVATTECDAAESFKDAYVMCSQEDLVVIDSPLGLPGRAIRNTFLEAVAEGVRRPTHCPWHCLRTCNPKESPYCIAGALMSAKRGDLSNGFAFAGANAHRVDRIVPVAELMEELAVDYVRLPSGVR